MTVKKEAEKIYEDGLVGYGVKKLFGDHKSKNKNKGEYLVDSKSIQVREIEDKVSRKSSKNSVLPLELQREKINTITEEIEQITINENTGNGHSTTDNDLLKDIKSTLSKQKIDKKIDINQSDSISDIFKINIKLQTLLSNMIFEEFEDYIRVDDKFISYIGIGSVNNTVEGDIMPILSDNDDLGEFNLQSYFEPIKVMDSKKLLMKKRRQINIEYQIQVEKKGQMGVQPELIQSIEELTNIINGLASHDFKIYKFYNIIQLVDSDLDRLQDRKSRLKVTLETMNYNCVYFRNLQEPVHNSFGISGSQDSFTNLTIKNRIPYIYTSDENLSYIKHFVYREDISVEGIPIGINIWTNRMVCRDFWGGDNYNMCVFGSSGTGKSYTEKLICLREYNTGVKLIIIDPDGEFEDLTKNIGGSYIDIGPNSGEENKINPFDFTFPRLLIQNKGTQDIAENLSEYTELIKKEFNSFLANLKTLIAIIISTEKISIEHYSEISTLLVDFFLNKGGINDHDIYSYFNIAKNPLDIRQFYLYLSERGESKEIDAEAIRSISKGLFDYASKNGNYTKFLGIGITAVNINNDWTAFNLKQIKESGPLTVITFIIMSFLEQIFAQRQDQRTRIVIDEASTFLGENIEIAGYITKLFQRARKYNMGITLIAQGINNLFVDFKSSEKEVNYGNTIIQNTENLIILSQKANALEIIEEKLQPTDKEMEFLRNLKTEKENGEDVRGKALVITGTSTDQIYITAEAYIHKYINTDPNKK